MNSCVVYFYKSNKNYFKEDYESAYICSYLKKFGNSDVFLYSPATPLALNTKYDLYFIKIYEKEQLSDLYLFIKQNSISVSTIFFYGQYCRNNYELFLGYFSSCGGVIVEDEYDTITSIMESSNACKGIAYVADGVIRKNLGASHISIEKIPNGDRRISKNINQSFAEVVFSRGCRRHCSFCTIASSKAYDCKSNRLILEELQEIVATTNIKEIIFKDLSFDDRIYVYGKKSIGELAEKIIENNLNIKYDVNFRIGTFSSQNTEDVLLFRLLRKSGLVRILLGVESFVESDLRLYNKTYQVSDIIDTIQLCRQNLIYPICSFIFLNPYTKLSDFEYNLGECNRLHLLDFLPASLNVLRPEKESLLYKRLLKDKMLIEGLMI